MGKIPPLDAFPLLIQAYEFTRRIDSVNSEGTFVFQKVKKGCLRGSRLRYQPARLMIDRGVLCVQDVRFWTDDRSALHLADLPPLIDYDLSRWMPAGS